MSRIPGGTILEQIYQPPASIKEIPGVCGKG